MLQHQAVDNNLCSCAYLSINAHQIRVSFSLQQHTTLVSVKLFLSFAFFLFSGERAEKQYREIQRSWCVSGTYSIRTYSNHLNTRQVLCSNGRFVSGCQMVRYSNGGLKTGLKKPVYCSKCLVFEWSIKSCDFTIWIPGLWDWPQSIKQLKGTSLFFSWHLNNEQICLVFRL